MNIITRALFALGEMACRLIEQHMLKHGLILAATYTPATLITAKVMGNGSGNIATWRYQNTGGAGTFGIVRTATFCSVAARAVTVEQGSTAGDTAAQKILDAYVLTVNVPYVLNGWFTVQNNDYFEGFANNTDVIGAAYGYTFA